MDPAFFFVSIAHGVRCLIDEAAIEREKKTSLLPHPSSVFVINLEHIQVTKMIKQICS